MEIRQLKIFVTVAGLLNFTQAAEVLGYAQSNVTTQIRLLEEEFETRLFERLGKRVALTPDGEKLLKYANQILKYSEEAKESLNNGHAPHGSITVGVAESLCVFRLPSLFKEYCKRFPNVKLVLKLGIPSDFSHWLRENSIDIAFCLAEKLDVKDLHLEASLPEPMVIVGEPNHPLCLKGAIGPADIEGQCLILTEAGCTYRAVIERILNQEGIKPGSTLEFDSVEAIKQFAASGMGIALLPRAAVERELQNNQLADLNWIGPNIEMFTQVVYHKDKWLSPTLDSFIELIRERYQ